MASPFSDNPFEVNWDAFAAISLASIGAIGFNYAAFKAVNPDVKNFCALAGCGLGAVTTFLSFGIAKNEQRLAMRITAEDDILMHGLTEEYMAALTPVQPDMIDVVETPAELPTAGAKPLPKRQIPPCPRQGEPYETLWQYLSQPKLFWLLNCLQRRVIKIVGRQGSFKTTLAAVIAMLRRIFYGHHLIACDPHGHQNQEEKWIDGFFELHGSRLDYDAIARQINRFLANAKARTEQDGKQHPITFIWDELTNYEERLPDKSADGFIKTVLSDARKSGQYVILISHGDTITASGGKKSSGTKVMQDQGMVKLFLQTEADAVGYDHPAFKGKAVGLEHDENLVPLEYAIELDARLTPKHLASLFADLATIGKQGNASRPGADFPEDPLTPSGNPKPPPSPVSPLGEAILKNLKKSEVKPKDINQQKFEAIANYIQRKQTVSKRQIQQAKLLGQEKIDARFIEGALDLLESQGMISVNRASSDWMATWRNTDVVG